MREGLAVAKTRLPITQYQAENNTHFPPHFLVWSKIGSAITVFSVVFAAHTIRLSYVLVHCTYIESHPTYTRIKEPMVQKAAWLDEGTKRAMVRLGARMKEGTYGTEGCMVG